MVKEDILQELREAKAAHTRWVQKAKLLIEGFQIEKDAIPVNATACVFGCWFYGEAQKLNALRNNSMESMAKVEELHMNLHDIYLNIYKIFYSADNKGFFSKLFGKKKKVTEESKKFAKEYFVKLEEISKALIEELNRMERRIIAINGEEISKL